MSFQKQNPSIFNRITPTPGAIVKVKEGSETWNDMVQFDEEGGWTEDDVRNMYYQVLEVHHCMEDGSIELEVQWLRTDGKLGEVELEDYNFGPSEDFVLIEQGSSQTPEEPMTEEEFDRAVELIVNRLQLLALEENDDAPAV